MTNETGKATEIPMVSAEPMPTNGSGALAIRANEPMVMDIRRSLPQAKAQFEAIQEFVKDVLKESVAEDKEKGIEAKDGDYGRVPGIAKPFLFKSGAEKIAALFGYAPVYVTLEKIEDFGERAVNGFFFYRYRCDLTSKNTGAVMGSGIGSCNSKEERYRWAQTERVCPNCQKAAIIKGKKEYGGGWLCFQKKGGCGNKWPDGDRSIESQSTERVEREAFSLVNTIDKMAQKRALVAAVLIATGTSALFTQDEETVEASDKGATAKPATVVSGATASPPATEKPGAKAAPAESASGPFWREAAPIEVERHFLHPEDKHGKSKSKKGGELPEGCRYQVTQEKGVKGKPGYEPAVFAKMVDANLYGADPRNASAPGPKPATVVSVESPAHGPLQGDNLDREIALEIRKRGWTPSKVTLRAHALGAQDGEWTRADEAIKMRLLSALCDSEVAVTA